MSNKQRGKAPLYGLISTKSITGKRVIHKTLGITEGFEQITTKTACNFGVVIVTVRENGDFSVKLDRHKSPPLRPDGESTYRGVTMNVLEDNFPNLEDEEKNKPTLKQESYFEHLAHQEYTDKQ